MTTARHPMGVLAVSAVLAVPFKRRPFSVKQVKPDVLRVLLVLLVRFKRGSFSRGEVSGVLLVLLVLFERGRLFSISQEEPSGRGFVSFGSGF
ncbi:hypothetical protein [Prosthecobacter fluviatilis]|uniref:hypothetical protein n=1 Tax=Prosthecobacter fluviatilis TaxID=445931 RepID=UPI00366B3FD4